MALHKFKVRRTGRNIAPFLVTGTNILVHCFCPGKMQGERGATLSVSEGTAASRPGFVVCRWLFAAATEATTKTPRNRETLELVNRKQRQEDTEAEET